MLQQMNTVHSGGISHTYNFFSVVIASDPLTFSLCNLKEVAMESPPCFLIGRLRWGG